MYKIVLILIPFLVVACKSTPQKQRDWIKNGVKSSPQELQLDKNNCEYDLKVKESSELIGKSISVGRYQSADKSDVFTEKAAKLLKEAADCMQAKGYGK